MFYFCIELFIINNYGDLSFCISLIIPSTFEDINRCYNTLIKSVCKSLTYPNEIVIVISGIMSNNITKIKTIEKELRKCTNVLNIIYRRMKHNAASNRNIGYSYSHCPIISYFDVDDIMSVYRISVIYKLYKENSKIDVVFHSSTKQYYLMNSKNISNIYYKYAVTNQYNIITERCRKTYHFDNRIYQCDVSNGFYITNGWPTLKRYIMKFIKFNESLTSTEDLDFISRVVVKGYRVALFKMPLGFYIKDSNCKI